MVIGTLNILGGFYLFKSKTFIMRREKIYNGGYYHIYNREVDKRQIFQDVQDYEKFLRCMRRSRFIDDKKIVDICAFCLMDNHYHIVLGQLDDGGISRYMHKIGTIYTDYFNQKYSRSGSLFEGPYKAKPIIDDAHLIHISRYIHLNPMKYFCSTWKKRGVVDVKAAFDHLREYKWSSYLAMFTRRASFLNTEFVKREFKTGESYDRFLEDWMKFGSPLRLDKVF